MLTKPRSAWLFSRLLPYWLTLLATCWTLAFLYFWNAKGPYERYEKRIDKLFVAIKDKVIIDWSELLVGFMTPLLLAATLAAVLLTNEPLPTWRLSWVNKIFGCLRRFRIEEAEYGVAIYKRNQFGVGPPNFNLMAFWLVVLPGVALFVTSIHQSVKRAKERADEEESYTQLAVESISYTAGWVGTILLSFFLIPVTRHSVLLVAMNWSPIHALRIHVWAGYTSFFFIFLHGVMIAGVWFKWAPGHVYEEFIPPKECWTGTYTRESRCSWKYYNFTGMMAFLFFAVLWVSSFEWFRRKWYRLFYILHVVFGTLTLVASVWHFEFIGLYLLPSILYYLASTMPTLIQALASRFRGGVKILQVVELDDAGNCLEVRVSMNTSAQTILTNSHPSQFIKLCVPKISMVWHPFTVYHHPEDKSTLRLMFRPIGPFTKALRSSLLSLNDRPVTLIDGFYRGNDHCQQALMCHDHVSIVAGGVAVTPFLSMIFAILKELQAYAVTEPASEKNEAPILRSLTLIWSCREPGLLTFIKNTYFTHMTTMAQSIPNFVFKIKIHFTGGKTFLNTSFTTATMKHFSTESSIEEEVTTEDHIEEKPNVVATIEDGMENAKSISTSPSKGHTMELARMMPARFSSMKWNLPYFIAFTSSVWLAFHIMFSQYDLARSYRDRSEEAWLTILVVIFFFLFGVLVEGSVLLFRKRWPAPRLDDFHVNPAAHNGVKSLKFTGDSVRQPTEDKMESYSGRPNSSDMLADAQLAAAPGIFMCGPKAMTQLLREAAGKENSTLGFLTRYVIYDESFEM